MKWVQTYLGDIVNWEYVQEIIYKDYEKKGKQYYYSFVVMKNGEEKPFLEVPDSFYEEGMHYQFTNDCLVLLHIRAVEIIEDFHGVPERVIKWNWLSDKSWADFIDLDFPKIGDAIKEHWIIQK